MTNAMAQIEQDYIAELTCDHGLIYVTGNEVCLTCAAEIAALEAQCLIHGHNLVCETYAGPDSGGDIISCIDCGADFSVGYY